MWYSLYDFMPTFRNPITTMRQSKLFLLVWVREGFVYACQEKFSDACAKYLANQLN